MKLLLEYELNLPEEQAEYFALCAAKDWARTCSKLDTQLRNWRKYPNQFKSVNECLEAVRSYLRDELTDRNISLEMIE